MSQWGVLCECVFFFFALFCFFCFVLGLMNETRSSTGTVNVKYFIENVQMLLHKL